MQNEQRVNFSHRDFLLIADVLAQVMRTCSDCENPNRVCTKEFVFPTFVERRPVKDRFYVTHKYVKELAVSFYSIASGATLADAVE